jgi:bis(5'-nucleosyl)-tetraphosphatase (symmetrical)
MLLEQARFDPKLDTLWIAGDLVARGPDSLEVLRFAKSFGESVKVVLGNHDLHLLAVANGIHRIKDKDRTRAILEAPDRDELLDWLRQQPLMQEHAEFVVCHAGVSPLWDLDTARANALYVQEALSGSHWVTLLKEMYDNQPELWDSTLTGYAKLRYIINAFTRMRYCYANGGLDMACKQPPSEVSDPNLVPWFEWPDRVKLSKTVLFGHWAALEGYQNSNVIGLDTGCVWGGSLTMIRWEDQRYFVQAAL